MSNVQCLMFNVSKACLFLKKKVKCPIIVVVVLLTVLMVWPVATHALYQPWIAEQAARKAYNEKKATYNSTDQKKLDNLAAQIVEINTRRTNELTVQTEAQGEILDEYQARTAPQSNAQIDKARYWLTYAHEAVAFQAAKNYIFELRSEANLKGDVTPTVNGFKNDLSVLRGKVVNSQKIIQDLVQGS